MEFHKFRTINNNFKICKMLISLTSQINNLINNININKL